MRTLFPAIKANGEQAVQVSELHCLFVAEYGNPEGVPVIMLHDGPGGNGREYFSRLCDPRRYRMIIADQRGCGRSTPYGEITDNDSWALIRDMEFLRQQLGIDRWLLYGESWGAALALLYAIEYPQQVFALLLHSPFLARRSDLEWRYDHGGGAAQLFPDHFQQFLWPLPPALRESPLLGYQQILTKGNELERVTAAKAWSIWRGELTHLLPRADLEQHYGQTHLASALARLECHFYSQGCFWEDDYLLKNLHKIHDLPSTIVQGRYDMLCNLAAAQTLVDNWPGSRLQIIPGAGHCCTEAGIVDGLIHSTEAMADWLYGDKH